ncbi:unnamed protein product [Phytophthora lilii]|uniref:Unnamed protein product n=1 Tax=Phytophthora lilii TaxID=2077276 RepID=A0A9W7CNQ0_9STRA|nr:unnamed protein product [Phytophthora lilii]
MIELSKANKDKRDKQVIRNLQRYSLVKGKIFYQAPSDDRPRLVLPNITELLDALLYVYHDAKCYGHPRVERTLCHVEKDYYWRKMEKTIKMYVQSCEVCQRIKGRNTKPPGLLRSHAIPATRWTHLAMDFIVALPEINEGYHAILVVIDRLTKRADFLPTTMIATAMETARLYRDRIFALHGLLEEILSDRDSKFTSAFWTNLCEMLGTHQKTYKCFSATSKWRNGAKFTYNSRHQSSISMSPFEADLGYPPITPARWKSVKESKVWNDTAQTLSKEFLEHQQDVLAKARRSLQAAQDRMSNYYDKNRPVQELKIGDRVLLSTNNLATFHAGTTKKKLGPKWIGPYAVSEEIGHDYYRLELATRVKFHPVFHTSMLKPYVQSDCLEQIILKSAASRWN